MKATALVPIKENSERVKNKNLRLFNGVPLFTIILHTLEQCSYIDEIIVDTDCEPVKDYIRQHLQKTIVVDRPAHLSGEMVTANALIAHDLAFAKNGHLFQTHCTNPLLTSATIDAALAHYFNSLNKFDSLFAVNRIQARTYWLNGEPINHRLNEMKRTQDLEAVFEENSSFFIFSKTVFQNAASRNGFTPQLYELNRIESIDIDYENDFLLAELIHQNRFLFKDIFLPKELI